MSGPGQPKQKIRTMEELSSAIGISRPTLSKFFQNAESVRSSTRERIEAALDTVDYIPNFFATKMNRQSTRIIGVVLPYLNDLFYTSLLQSIEEAATEHGYNIIIQSAHDNPELETKVFENLISMSADGVIAAPVGQTNSISNITRLKDELPLVFVDSRFPDHFDDVDFVGTNNQQSISMMVDYLYQSGGSPSFLTMPRINSNSLERELAYIKSAEALGFSPQLIPTNEHIATWDFEKFAYETMDAHFSEGKFVDTTILCANDRLAIGVIRAANKYDLIPNGKGEVSKFRVAGHDDHPLSAYVYPALTTVSRKTDGIGRAAVEQLLDQIENGRRVSKGVVRTFDAELRLRESA